MRARSRLAVGGGVLAMVVALSCSDDGVNPCPTGSCDLPGNTVVKFKFNNYPELGFDSDTCSELSVAKVRVDVIGVEDPTGFDTREVQCSEGQATFSDLLIQNYNVSVTPLDIDGNPLIKTDMPGRGTVPAAGPNARTEVTVNVQYDSWVRSYTGQFLFKLTWLGAACNPAGGTATVTQHSLTLMVNGSVVTQRTTNPVDQPLDGTVDIPCVPSTGMPLTVPNVPWGPATLHVIGKNDADEVLGDHTFDTFVGAGMFNPTLTFDTPADAMPPDM